jgi:MYXO-CTERM domain-containing protein
MVAAVGVLFMPRTLNVIDLSWNEPFVVMLLALTVFCAIRLPRLAPYALGLLLASKQYMPFALVLSPLLFGWEWRRLGAALLRAGITAMVVTLPLVLPNVGAFIHSAILFQIHQPFRRDALSFLILWARTTGMPPSAAPGFVALLVVGALVLWRLRPSPANFAAAVAVSYFAFFAFNKQAFMNYYFFVIAALWCSVAALDLPLPAIAESK